MNVWKLNFTNSLLETSQRTKIAFYLYVLLELLHNFSYSLNAFLIELGKDGLDPIIKLSQNNNNKLNAELILYLWCIDV